jgi:hypothetical protein
VAASTSTVVVVAIVAAFLAVALLVAYVRADGGEAVHWCDHPGARRLSLPARPMGATSPSLAETCDQAAGNATGSVMSA